MGILVPGKTLLIVGPNTRKFTQDYGSTKKSKEETLKNMSEGPPLLALIPSQANFVLPNGLTNYPVLPILSNTLTNGSVCSALIYYSDQFPSKSSHDSPITLVAMEVSGMYCLLVGMYETTNNIQPTSENNEYGECLFEDKNYNDKVRIKF